MANIVEIMEEFNRLLSERESAQWIAMGRRWKELESTLSIYMQQLAEQIDLRRTNGLPVNKNSIYQMERYKDLLHQVFGESKKYESYASGLISQEQLAYGELGIRAAQQAIMSSAGYSVMFNRVNVAAVQNMAGITADGSPLFDVLAKRALAPEMAAGITNKLIEATGLGYNPVKTARMMADGLSQGLTKALTIARTEQVRVYRQASLDQYRESGVVSQWQRHAAKSERTCLVCLALDGQIQNVSDLFASHPNCRCYTVPIIKGAEYTPLQSGQDWLVNKPAEYQQKILGNYYDLYRQGTPLKAMVNVIDDPTWGPTLRTVPVKDLVAEPQ